MQPYELFRRNSLSKRMAGDPGRTKLFGGDDAAVGTEKLVNSAHGPDDD